MIPGFLYSFRNILFTQILIFELVKLKKKVRRLTELETRPTELETIDLLYITSEYVKNLTVGCITGRIMLKDALEADYYGTLRKVLEKYCGSPHLVDGYFMNATEECKMSFADALVSRAISINKQIEDNSFFRLDYQILND